MLSLFPQILFLAPLGMTLLRVAAGIVFLSIAFTHYQKRSEFAETEFPLIGRASWAPPFAAAIEALIAGTLIVGIYTQLAALVGAIGAAKYFLFKKRYGELVPVSRAASALLFVICISLLVSGAGIFAFDLPL